MTVPTKLRPHDNNSSLRSLVRWLVGWFVRSFSRSFFERSDDVMIVVEPWLLFGGVFDK